MNRLFKTLFKIAAAAGILLAAFVTRADEGAKPRPMENRFLFIINVSSAMKSRTNGIEEAVVRLLETDMHGEFRKGDTIGLWTYNDEIHAEFPMQTWSPDHKKEIISDVERFLHHQHYAKRAHIEKVYPLIGRTMRMSERLTVILIYDPSEEVEGTQFDEEISELQREYAHTFNAAHWPVVTVLAGRNGEVYNYTVNFPKSVKIPHTAIPEPPPQTNAPPTNAIAVTPPVVIPPPPRRHFEIIMSGTNNLSHSTTENVLSLVNAAPSTNSTASNIIMVGSPAPVTNAVVIQSPPPASNATIAVAPSLPNSNTIAAPQGLRVETTSTPSAVVVTPVTSNVPPAASKSEQAPQPAAVASQPPQTPTPKKSTAPTEAIVATTPVPSPTPVASESASANAHLPSSESSKPEPPQHAQAAPVSPATPTPIAATGIGQIELFVMAISLLTIAIVLVVLVVRRSRGHGQPSLISQSIDRPR